MRVHFLAAAFLVAISASSALAQVVGESGPNVRTFTSSNDVLGLVAKLKTNLKDGQPLAFEPILQLAPYSAILEYRAAMARAAVHETEAELMYVIDGSGTIVTGGKLTDPQRVNAANLSGANIEGGTSQTINKGDFLIVPQNRPSSDHSDWGHDNTHDGENATHGRRSLTDGRAVNADCH